MNAVTVILTFNIWVPVCNPQVPHGPFGIEPLSAAAHASLQVECLYQAFKRAEGDVEAKLLVQALLSRILEVIVDKLAVLRVSYGVAGLAAYCPYQPNMLWIAQFFLDCPSVP